MKCGNDWYRRGLWVLAALWMGVAGAADSATVEYRAGRLSVDFPAIPLSEALALTTEKTGVEFVGVTDLSDPLRLRFADEPLEAGIRRLLAGYNYMILRETSAGADTRLQRVRVLGKIGAPRDPPTTGVVADPAAQPAGEASQPPAVVLRQQSSGHYSSTGTINGKPVEFVIDTGATTVALSADLARQLGLRVGAGKHIDTANGRTDGYETTLQSVTLGGLQTNGVRALVMPSMKLGRRVLLGMNFLRLFEIVQQNGTLTIRPHGG